MAKIRIEPQAELVTIPAIERDEYHIDSGLLTACLLPTGHGIPLTFGEKCHRSVLVMNFKAVTVTVSDISTHAQGCEAFTERNTYRLAPGRSRRHDSR